MKCLNCPKDVTWSSKAGWMHEESKSYSCDDSRRTGAAPPNGIIPCHYRNEAFGSMCDGPYEHEGDHRVGGLGTCDSRVEHEEYPKYERTGGVGCQKGRPYPRSYLA